MARKKVVDCFIFYNEIGSEPEKTSTVVQKT